MSNYTSGFDWLWGDWLKLRRQLILLCTRHAAMLFDGAGCYIPAHFDGFARAVLEDIQARIPEDNRGMWQECLALLVHLDDLKQRLEKDFRKSSTGVSPERRLGRVLQFFLEDARRELAAEETGETPARIKTWERLNRMSMELVKQQETAAPGARPVDRCSEEHFQQLHEEIKRVHPRDFNYPQKLTSIRDFFHIFCECCRKRVTPENRDPLEDYSLVAGGVSPLADTLFNGNAMDALARAIGQLDAEDRELLNAAFRLGLEPLGYLSESAYRRAKKWNQHTYEHRKRQALENLHRLFESACPDIALEAGQ